MKVLIALNQFVLDASMMPSCRNAEASWSNGLHKPFPQEREYSGLTLDFRVAIYAACQPHHLIAAVQSYRPTWPQR